MSSHRRFAAAELKRTSPSPRVVSSESDDDVPEVSHPSQPRAASPRGDVVQDDLRGVLEAEAGGFATFDDDPSGLLGLRRIDTAETLNETHPWSFDRPSLGEARQVTPDASPRPVFFACSAPAAPPLPGVGLVVGSRLHRIRRRCGGLVLPEGFESKPWPKDG